MKKINLRFKIKATCLKQTSHREKGILEVTSDKSSHEKSLEKLHFTIDSEYMENINVIDGKKKITAYCLLIPIIYVKRK